MFPKNWDIKRVKEEIALVYDTLISSGRFDELKIRRSPSFKSPNSNNSFDILIEFDELGNITNAYPKQ